MRIAVIGGGILGASVAWHLGQGGAAVTVFAGPAPGATAGSFAWINASWGNDAAYRRLRMASMALWPALGAAVPGVRYRRTGGLLWDLPEGELRAFAAEAAAEGYPVSLVGEDEARAREPVLRDPPALALLAPDEGMAEPGAPGALLAASEAFWGARLVSAEARPVEHAGRAAVRLGGETLAFDAVVLAAGVASAPLVAPLGLALAMTAPLGFLAWSNPVAPCLTGLVLTPEFHLRQTPDGRLVLGEDYAGTDPGRDVEGAARALLALAAARLTLRAPVYSHATLAARPTPGDGRPAVGALPVPGLWLALSHSGVTLAPAIGAFLAAEILTGRRESLLAPYAPGRVLQSA